MAFRVQYLLLANGTQDIGRGKLNILGTFDQVYAKDFPMLYPSFSVVALVIAENEDALGSHQVGIRIVRPTGQTVAETGGEVKVPAHAGNAFGLASLRLIIKIDGLTFREHGRHDVQLLVDGKELASHPILVTTPPSQG